MDSLLPQPDHIEQFTQPEPSPLTQTQELEKLNKQYQRRVILVRVYALLLIGSIFVWLGAMILNALSGLTTPAALSNPWIIVAFIVHVSAFVGGCGLLTLQRKALRFLWLVTIALIAYSPIAYIAAMAGFSMAFMGADGTMLGFKDNFVLAGAIMVTLNAYLMALIIFGSAVLFNPNIKRVLE